MFPSVLKNFNAFVNGRGMAGLVDEAELPELSIRTEEHRAGGMDGTAEMDMGQEPMRSRLVFAEYNAEVFKLFGLANGNAARIVLRGAARRDSDGVVTPIVAELHGRIIRIAQGTWQAGQKATAEVEMTVNYYRLNVAGEDLIEIDVENFKRIVGGVDQLAAMREALAL